MYYTNLVSYRTSFNAFLPSVTRAGTIASSGKFRVECRLTSADNHAYSFRSAVNRHTQRHLSELGLNCASSRQRLKLVVGFNRSSPDHNYDGLPHWLFFYAYSFISSYCTTSSDRRITLFATMYTTLLLILYNSHFQ